MAGNYINGITRHAIMSESMIDSDVNREREAVFVNDFDPNTVEYSGTELSKQRYIMAYEYDLFGVRERRNLTTLELLKLGSEHPNAGASNIYIAVENTEYKTLNYITADGLSVQKAVEQLDNGIVLKDADISDNKGNSIGLASDNCTILNGGNNIISDIIENAVVLNGDEAFIDTENETTIGSKVVNDTNDGYSTDAHVQSSVFILTATTIAAGAAELLLQHTSTRIKMPVQHINGALLYSSIGGMIILTGVSNTDDEVASFTNIYSFNGVTYNSTDYDPADPGSLATLTATQNITSAVNSATGIDVTSLTFGINSSFELIFTVTTSTDIRVNWMATVYMNKIAIDNVPT